VSRQILTTLAGAAALAIFIVGCGGGDGDGTTDSGTTAVGVELTKAQYIKRADATCSKQNEKLTVAFGKYSLSHPIKKGTLTKAQSREFSEKFFFPYVEKRIEILQELNGPDPDVKQVETIVVATEDGLAQAKKDLDSPDGQSPDPLAKAESLSRAYGLKICGET
jgi:hypothetical protein